MSTALRASATAGQSRPTQSREKKSFSSLLRRFAMRKGPLDESNSFTIGSDCTTTTIQNTAMATSHAPLTRQTSFLRNPRRRQVPLQCTSTTLGLMDWLQSDCPHELIPRVLAYAGPQAAAALSQTSKFWNEVMSLESTWRSLCEELYKVCLKRGQEVCIAIGLKYLTN